MRLEQKSFAEKYIEKIVLLVAIVLALGIVYLFVLDDHSVELPAGTLGAKGKAGDVAITPEQLEADIRDKAKQLNQKVTNEVVAPEIDGFTVPDYVARFWSRHSEKLLEHEVIPVQLVQRGPLLDGEGTTGEGKPVELVLPRMATDLAVRHSNHVVESTSYIKDRLMSKMADKYPEATPKQIEEYVMPMVKEIDSTVGTHVPRDIIQVLVRAKVDLEKYKEAILAVDEEFRMPQNWWDSYTGFLADVVVERQTLNPETGEWGDLTEIKPIPGSIIHEHRKDVAYVEKLASDSEQASIFKVNETTRLLDKMRQHGPDIAKPDALDYKSYTSLNMDAEIPEGLNLTEAEQARLFDVRKQISDLEAKLRRLTGATTTSPDTTGDLRGGYDEGFNPTPGRVIPGRPVAPRPVPGKSADPNRPDPAAASAKRRQEQIDKLKEKLDMLWQEKNKLEGYDVVDPKNPNNTRNNEFDNPAARPGGNVRPGERPRFPGGRGEFGQQLLDNNGKLPVVDVLSHDITVEHGKTYRYRLTYKMVNPLYQKDVKPEEVKNEYYSKLLIASEPSEWSEPITIEPRMYLFVNKASASTNSATFELYSILDGRRRKHEFSASPGDPVGGVAKEEILQPGVDGAPPTRETVEVNVRAPYVLVDVKEPPKAPGAIGSRGPITVILANAATGEIFVRNLQDDLDNSQRKILNNDAARSSQTAIGLNR